MKVPEKPSFWSFVVMELTRTYSLEYDEEQYTARREKVKSFFSIPWNVEKFMVYGCLQCADSFLFIYTFLPMRVLLTIWMMFYRVFSCIAGCKWKTLLNSAEICDFLKVIIILGSVNLMSYVDIAVVYHNIKSQSIIKLYIFYNMLEILDRLLSTFGQDLIDTLFWTATEPRRIDKSNIGVILLSLLSVAYVSLHSFLVLLQATILNVAINSSSSSLFIVMMSNNFVEIKGSVFRKFDRSSFYQLSCSDARERFHLLILLSIVVLLTMKEYAWAEDTFWILMGYGFGVLGSELLIDWIKHAFVTRFNELSPDIYKDYTYSLAYDVVQTRHTRAFTDHSDLVARRMGFIPLPLSVVVIRVLQYVIHIEELSSWTIAVIAYFGLIVIRIWISMYILGRASELVEKHQKEKTMSTVLEKTPLLPKKSNVRSVDSPTSPTTPDEKKKFSVEEKFSKHKEQTEDNAPNIESVILRSNSNVNITDIRLNEEVCQDQKTPIKRLESIGESENENLTRSEPNIESQTKDMEDLNASLRTLSISQENLAKKRAESEPLLSVTI